MQRRAAKATGDKNDERRWSLEGFYKGFYEGASCRRVSKRVSFRVL